MQLLESKRRDEPHTVIIPTTIVWVLFGTAIPTSPFSFMQMFLHLLPLFLTILDVTLIHLYVTLRFYLQS